MTEEYKHIKLMRGKKMNALVALQQKKRERKIMLTQEVIQLQVFQSQALNNERKTLVKRSKKDCREKEN